MKKRLLGALICAPLAVLSVATGVASASVPTPDFGPTTMTVPNTFARGIVTNNGVPAAGVLITTRIWPDDATLSAGAAGEKVTMYPLATVTTDTNGAFSVALDPASLPPGYTGTGGRVDALLIATATGNREISWNFTATRAEQDTLAGWQMSWSTPQADLDARENEGVSEPADLRIDMGTDSYVIERHDQPSTWEEASEGTSIPRAYDYLDGQSIALDPCIVRKGDWFYGREERFAQAYGWSGAKITVHQKYGVDHTMGVGLNGPNSTWHQSGTRTRDLQASATRNGVVDANVYNRINYRNIHYMGCDVTYRKPMGAHSLLTNFTYAPHPTFSYCETYNAGEYVKYRGQNITYGAGIDIGPIKVSAQSGWGSGTTLTWHVNERTRLCGSGPKGWVSARRAEARRG